MNLILRLRGEMIDGRQVCCLRTQLAEIVRALSDALGDLNWYAADVDTTESSLLPAGAIPQPIGRTEELLQTVQKVDQFLRGVFLAVNPEKKNPRFREFVDTEDPVDVELGDAIVEVRAFDTTFFEILTRNQNVLAVLTSAFDSATQEISR